MSGQIDLVRFSSLDAYREALAERSEVFTARWLWGEHLEAACRHSGRYQGYCSLCARPAEFSFSAGSGEPVNLREELHCDGCGLSARARVVASLLKTDCPPERGHSIYLTEQTTSLYRFVKQAWSAVIGSEYFEETERDRIQAFMRDSLGLDERLRFEDVTELSFADATLDAIATCDVLEHVPDYRAAATEFARVLKPGGRLILTVPFLDQDQQTLTRARVLEDGQIEHLEEPEYHGDPLDPKGVLAFYHFGWDLLETLRSAGFSSAEWCLPWAPAEGVFSGQWTLLARR
ncbi:MAG: methyltransferase domain-containing protein [Wenzhouxiangella sp.]|nr:MAG: methyltransferase domain-containing protein [Wenzhouxiangella sp.]